MERIPEADWMVLQALKPVLLERFCRKVLDEANRLAGAPPGEAHAAYGWLYACVRERDRVMASLFDRWSRSEAPLNLLLIRREGLLTPGELASFSAETRAFLQQARR